MSKSHKGDTGYWHNKGEQDKAKGEYKPPHDNPRDNISQTYTDKEIKDRQAYSEGRKNVKK